jgi:ribose/xylose/arabinose/galactoside ABC-type transport system permease subunit
MAAIAGLVIGAHRAVILSPCQFTLVSVTAVVVGGTSILGVVER